MNSPIFFESQWQFRDWLIENHCSETELLVGFHKVSTGKPCMVWAESVDQALCFGWIDGIRRSIDSKSYSIRFTPRRNNSIWSAINIKKVESLIEMDLMFPAGLKEVEAAKADGRWAMAYDSPSTMTIPEDFLCSLDKDEAAKTFFDSLNKSNKYAIAWRLQTAKTQETREKRMQKIIVMLSKGEKFH